MWKSFKIFLKLLKKTYISWDRNEPYARAATIAYYALFLTVPADHCGEYRRVFLRKGSGNRKVNGGDRKIYWQGFS